MKTSKVERTIHYYYLNFEFLPEYMQSEGERIIGLFRIIHRLAIDLSSIRYQRFGDKSIFIQNIKFDTEGRYISGMIRCIRTDILPELMNTKTDVSREIDAKEEEGLLETTHFIIDFTRNDKTVLAIESNQQGAKIVDFVQYLKNIGSSKSILMNIGFIPISQNNLEEFKRRMNKCSELIVRVHKDNIPLIKNVDNGLGTVFQAVQDEFASDYAELCLKFDYKLRPGTPQTTSLIGRLIDKFLRNSENTRLFNTLSVKAEDSDKNYLLETFDLLANKIKSEIKVAKKPKHRTIVSSDMFIQMKSELIKKNI